MEEFKKALGGLNKAQAQAVKTIEGPVLVIAGPGTGKTQLLALRAAQILKQDPAVLPSNILCLTFTEAGVEAMRERLTKYLGQAAYEINIGTYHAFGSQIIRRYPQYFEAGLEPVDDLASFTILRSILASLPFSNALKFADSVGSADILRFISDAKRALFLPKHIKKIAQQNQKQIDDLNRAAKNILNSLGVISKKSLPLFEQLVPILTKQPKLNLPEAVLPLSHYTLKDLQSALDEVAKTGKTSAITSWKNSWLVKDSEGNFVFAGIAQNQKLASAADVYEKYQKALAARRLYDYDDMILRAIDILSKNPQLKYTLAEQYLYIMLDEFQDTNQAQMRLIELLTDHPVHEGRPNVLAVGDDDQAIYAFQGADHANMVQLARHYRGVKIISSSENYRSQPEIIQTAENIAAQINDRLHQHFEGVEKNIVPAKTKKPGQRLVTVREFKSDAAQHEWVAAEIKRLNQKEEVPFSEIAILAPRHRNLMPILPYLARQGVPVRYQRRENILDAPLVRQLEQMSRLSLALRDNNQILSDSLWPEVISYDFWGLDTEEVWKISWQAYQAKEPWIKTILKNPKTKKIGLFFLRLKDISSTTTLEQQLDILTGLPDVSDHFKMPAVSPFFEYYFGQKAQKKAAEFIELLGHLSTLRAHLSDRQRLQEGPMSLTNFIQLIDEYRAAGLNVLDTNAYREADQAVNVMTAYAAKGREFKVVFLVAAHDEVWGGASRTRGQYLSLPPNLQYIRYQGASEDERLRLLYVAVTRTKTHLYFANYTQSLAGKPTTRLKYLDIRQDEEGRLKSHVLPDKYSLVQTDDSQALSLEAAQDYWSAKHQPPFKPTLKRLLIDHLARYQLSASHVNAFTDVTSGGPQSYLLNYLLRFPRAKHPAEAYGTAIHETIRWVHQTASLSSMPQPTKVLEYFSDRLSRQRLQAGEHQLFLDRGISSLTAWLAQRGGDYKPTDRYEFNFRGEAAFLGDVHLTGVVDRLRIDSRSRRVTITDYKTGQPYHRWATNNIRLHKYRQQLLIYKILVEKSRSFGGYKVEKGVLEFVEPDKKGQIVQLELLYDEAEVENMGRILRSIWHHVQALELPDTKNYSRSITGIRAFEKDLAAG